MWGDIHQQGELFYDEEITKKSKKSIEEVPDSVEEVLEKVEGKEGKNTLVKGVNWP